MKTNLINHKLESRARLSKRLFWVFSIALTISTLPSFGQLSGTVSDLSNVLCYGQATGSVTITGSGGTSPYEYKIDGQDYQESGIFTGLTAGSYTFIVRDADEETATVSVTISQPESVLDIDLTSVTNIDCTGYETGEIDITVSGGTPAYTFAWSTADGIGLDATAEDQNGLGAGTYIVVVTDANGCVADYQVIIEDGTDSTAPEIIGGEDGSASCTGSDPSSNSAYIVWRDNFAGASATDNCGNATLILTEGQWYSGNCADEIVVTITATDDYGNTVEKTFDFRIADTTPPVLTGGADGSAEGTGSDPGSNEEYLTWRNGFAGIEATDACGAATMTYDEGTWTSTDEYDQITVHFVAVDECGLISVKQHVFTISKSGGPTIICPPDIMVDCMYDLPTPDISSVSYTGEGVVIEFIGDVSDGNTCPKIITRTYRATDENDNFVECSQIITVNDQTPPVISCPGPAFVASEEEIPEVDITLVSATDNCGARPVITFVNDIHSVNNCSKIVTRTYMATDACGNTTTCTQLIIVNDIMPPAIICPEPLEVGCLADIPEVDISQVVAVDNCGFVSVSHKEDIVDGFNCPMIVTRIYEALDESGNISECFQIITVNDEIPPILLNVPDDIFVTCDAIPEPADVSAEDDCHSSGSLEVEFIEIENSVENCEGVIVRQWIATDECGNSTTDLQTIVVSPITGIDTQTLDGELVFYPNPTRGILNINGISEPVKIEVFNINGVLIKADRITDNKIDLSELSNGTYFIKTTDKKGISTRIIVIKQ